MRSLLSVSLGAFLAVPLLQPASRGGSIAVGTVVLTAGMPQEKALAALTNTYTLKPAVTGGSGPVDSLLVYDGKTLLANVAFRSGRLMSVFRYWDPSDQQKGADLARKVYGAVGSLVKDGYTTCTLDVGSSEGPQAEVRTAFIMCGPRSLELSVVRSEKGSESSMLVEKLQ